MIAEVHITGLRELRAALRQVDRTLLPELRTEMKQAVDIVVHDVQARVPKDSGAAAASVRSTASGNRFYIKAGGARVPYYGWLDFGGKLPDKRPNKKKALAGNGFGPKGRAEGARRSKIGKGRYVYPAILRNMPKVIEAAADAFEHVARRAGLNVR